MTTLNKKLLQAIIGSDEQVHFLLKKLELLEKLTNEYDSASFEERLQDIIDVAEEVSFNGLLYPIYKNLGELAINYLLDGDKWQEYGVENYDIIEKYNIPAIAGVNSVYDSILGVMDFENITDSDIDKFEGEIIEDFNLHQKYFSNTSVFKFKNDEELAKHIKFCEAYLNYHLLNDTQYLVEIYETDDVYEGKLIYKDTEEELEDSTSGRYCEISSVFKDLLDYINNNILNNHQEIDDWLEDSCCPKCKGFNYASKQDFEGNEIFRKWHCSCGAEWTERYNLTKVFYNKNEKELTSEDEDNLSYENKKMGDFLESIGLTPDEITDLVINGDKKQLEEAFYKAKSTL